MKAITLHQPWATLVALGQKRIETRSWSTPYRGPIAIHSSKKFTPLMAGCCKHLRFAAALRADFDARGNAPLQLGHIVAIAELVGCRPTRELRAELNTDDNEWHFGDFSDGPGGHGRWGLILANPQYLGIASVPTRGSLGIWDWDEKGLAVNRVIR